MIERIVVCLVIAALAIGAVHFFDAKVKRDHRAKSRKAAGTPEAEPAQVP